MYRHKSLGLLAGMLIAPRLITRFVNTSPSTLPGSGRLEHLLGVAGHYSLYAFLIAMPATGMYHAHGSQAAQVTLFSWMGTAAHGVMMSFLS